MEIISDYDYDDSVSHQMVDTYLIYPYLTIRLSFPIDFNIVLLAYQEISSRSTQGISQRLLLSSSSHALRRILESWGIEVPP